MAYWPEIGNCILLLKYLKHVDDFVNSSVTKVWIRFKNRWMDGGRGESRTAATPKMERFVMTVNGFDYHKALHLGCCSSPRSASGWDGQVSFLFDDPGKIQYNIACT